MRLKALILTVTVFLAGCATSNNEISLKKEKVRSMALAESILSITKVKLSKKQIDLSQQETTSIQFDLSQKADVQLSIFNEDNVCLKQIEKKNLLSGIDIISWDGTSNQGIPVPNGVYRYTLKATISSGETFFYEDKNIYGGEIVKVEDFKINSKDELIHYFLPKASRVRIRIGVDTGPLLFTLLDWEPRLSGAQMQVWNGKDLTGVMNLFDHPQTRVLIHAYALPANSIIVLGSTKSIYVEQVNHLEKIKSKDINKHSLHPRSMCHEPKLSLKFPNAQNKEGTAILKGESPVMLEIDPTDHMHLTNSRYEIIFFIDNIFLFEDEEGYTPFTYLFDTKNIKPGSHLLTANVVSFDDHIGAVTAKIIIETDKIERGVTS